MLKKSLVAFLHLVAARSIQDSDEACSSAVPVASPRCLLQGGRKAAALQMGGELEPKDFISPVEAEAPNAFARMFSEVAQRDEATHHWTGDQITIEFQNTSPDMKMFAPMTIQDWSNDDATKINKTYYELSFQNVIGGQILENPVSDKVKVFGFTNITGGIAIRNSSRLWTGKPSKPSSRLVYGIMVTNVPGDHDWTYSVVYGKSPPDVWTEYPPKKKVGKKGDNLFIVFYCAEDNQCEDDDVVISKVTFTPDKRDKDEIPEPEDVSNESALVKEKDIPASAAATPTSGVEDSTKDNSVGAQFGKMMKFAEMEQVQEKKTLWTGETIVLEFAKGNPDMLNLVTKTRKDWTWNGVTESEPTQVDKVYRESLLPYNGSQVVQDAAKDGFRLYGFKNKTSGIANEWATQWWTAKPGSKDALLVYGIEVLNVPNIPKWTCSIDYTKPPPDADVLKVYPMSGELTRSKEGHLFIVIECSDKERCGDESIQISSVTLDPVKKKMPKPEQVTPANTGKLPSDAEDSKGLANVPKK